MSENLVLTQLTIPEVRQLFREEIADFFQNHSNQHKGDDDEIGGIDLAVEVTQYAKETIYGLTSARKIPHSKRGKRLIFSRRKLLEWLAADQRKTRDEMHRESQSIN